MMKEMPQPEVRQECPAEMQRPGSQQGGCHEHLGTFCLVRRSQDAGSGQWKWYDGESQTRHSNGGGRYQSPSIQRSSIKP